MIEVDQTGHTMDFIIFTENLQRYMDTVSSFRMTCSPEGDGERASVGDILMNQSYISELHRRMWTVAVDTGVRSYFEWPEIARGHAYLWNTCNYFRIR